jgi:hypothetical protein
VEHVAQLVEPSVGVFGIQVILEPGATVGPVDDFGGWIRGVFADEVIPFAGQRTHFICPFELVQVHCAGFVNVIGCETFARHSVAVEDHYRGPVFAGVGGLGLVEEFDFVNRRVIVLNAKDIRVFLVLGEMGEFVDVCEAEHVAVEEDRCLIEVGKTWCKKTCKGEVG